MEINLKRQGLSCWFCQKPHLASNCEQIKSPFQRMKILSEQNRCLSCLKRGHTKMNCRQKMKCNSCGIIGHNKIVCTKGFEKTRKDENKNR
uniref:CCHC-type domain-containing protein n=1 Tax=Meloidogyne incognita TaxID=6306 RepID=A0A914NU44_MELIC